MEIELKSLGSKAKSIEASLTIGAEDEPIAIGKDGNSRGISERLSSIRKSMAGKHLMECRQTGWGNTNDCNSGWCN